MSAPERTFTPRELHVYANCLLGSAVVSYAITLAAGVQSAVGSMLMVLVGIGVHCWAMHRARCDR